MNCRRLLSQCVPLLLLPFLVGCPNPPDPSDNARRDRVLAAYFTPEAIGALQNIPLRYGYLGGSSGLAVGDDWGSRLASVYWGHSNERQVIVSSENVPDSVVVHEYVHQAYYSGLISRALWLERYARLKNDPQYSQIAASRESYIWDAYSSSFFTLLALLYDDGMTKELVAYMIGGWIDGTYELPSYFLEVYGRAIRVDIRSAK